MFEGDVGVILRDFGDGGAPELRDFEDVGLVDGGELLATLPRKLKGDAGDADDFVAGVAHGVPGFAGFLVPLAGRAEVEAAEEFAHEENVGAIDDFGAQWAVDGDLFYGEG